MIIPQIAENKTKSGNLIIPDTCPVCGSKNLTKIDRMNGYLSYSRVHGDTRLNEAKMAESTARYSVLSSVYNLEWVIQEKLPVHEVQQDNGTTAVPLNQSGGTIAPVERPVR